MPELPAGGGREGVELTGQAPNRASLRGRRSTVAADHPLAAAAGQRVLLAGGSAADAAIAMSAVLTVVQPHMSHLGGDLFALVRDPATGEVTALNSSGPAPSAASAEAYRTTGGIPDTGALAVTVPGCVAGWGALHERHGRLPWRDLFEPAIEYAARGFPASRALARAVIVGRERVYPGAAFKATFGHVSGDGGQMIVQPALAGTLERSPRAARMPSTAATSPNGASRHSTASARPSQPRTGGRPPAGSGRSPPASRASASTPSPHPRAASSFLPP